jgi:hypothetical protein
MKKTELGFLFLFYRAVALCGIVGSVLGLLLGGAQAAFSFFAGSLSIGFVLWMFHLVTGVILKPGKISVALTSVLFFLHFALLGGFFYAMIRLFVVSPAWYAAGLSIMLPGLLFAGLMHREAGDGVDTKGER